jgi:hypothetical protein
MLAHDQRHSYMQGMRYIGKKVPVGHPAGRSRQVGQSDLQPIGRAASGGTAASAFRAIDSESSRRLNPHAVDIPRTEVSHLL